MTPTSRDSRKDTALPDESLREPLDSLSIELGRISAEIQSINSGFQAQMQQVMAEAHAALQNQYRIRFENAIEEVREQLREQIQNELRKDFESEVQSRVTFQVAEAEKALRTQIDTELRKNFDSEVQSRVVLQLTEVEKELRVQIHDELRKEFEAEARTRGAVLEVEGVEKEIERVAAQLDGVAKEIAAMLDDPSIELSRVMRKRTEQAELKAYLNGLRFTIAEQGAEQGKVKGAGA